MAATGIPSVGNLLLAEVFVNNTNKEPVAYGLLRATATSGTTVEVHNVPAALAGSFGVRLSVAGQDRSREVIVGAAFPTVSTVDVDLSNAVGASLNQAIRSTSAASVEGIIRTTDTVPIEGVRVELSRYGNFEGGFVGACNCVPNLYRQETFSDAKGRFSFYDVPAGTNYQLRAGKSGYKNQGFTITQIPAVGTDPTHRFSLALEVAPFELAVEVRYGGISFPNTSVAIWGDYDRWVGSGGYAGTNYGMQADARGQTGFDGKFTFKGIPDGNINFSAGFRGGYYDFGQGPDGQRNYDGSGNRAGDDYRITVSSIDFVQAPLCPGPLGCQENTPLVFDKNGTLVSTGPVVFNITPAGGNAAGLIVGTVTFITTFTITNAQPLVIPATDPVVILFTEEYSGGNQYQHVGLHKLQGSFTAKTTGYAITISSGRVYRSEVLSTSWGEATNFDDMANLKTTSTVRVNFDITRSGRVKGRVTLPDGANYRPVFKGDSDPTSHSVQIEMVGENVDVRANSPIDEFGEFEFPNLAPGLYTLRAIPYGKAAEWPEIRLDGVRVTVGRTTSLVVKLTEALYVKPQIFGLPAVSTAAWQYSVIALPAGQQLTQKTLSEGFFDEPRYASNYSTAAADWETLRMEPGLYDFYLVINARYRPGENPSYYYGFRNFIGQLKNVAVQESEANPALGTAGQPISIGILGSVGQASLTGRISGDRLFTVSDLERVFANFENEIANLIPAILLYDNVGDLKGFGMALPDETAIFDVKSAIDNKDATLFINTLKAPHLPRYLIASLAPGRYTAVFMSPNYPPVVQEVTLAGETTLDFDFDARDITAGSIRGVVRSSTTGEAIPDALVTLKHRTIDRNRKTGADGRFAIDNLPPGIYRIEVNKPGFTVAGDKVALAGNGTLNLTFALYPTTSSIRGSVFLRKFPSPAVSEDVKITAYDETANVADPEAFLPRISVLTGSDGVYEIPAVLPGHVYKIAAGTPGKLLETLAVTALPGVTTAPDIVLKDSPPEIVLKVRKSLDTGKVEIQVKSPKELTSAPAGTYTVGQSYDAVTAVSLTLIPGPENTYLAQFTPTPTQRFYTIRVVAGEDNNQLEKLVVFDQLSQARTDQFVHEAAVAGGEVSLDSEQAEYSGVELDAGALTATSTGTVSDQSNLVGGFFSALPSVRVVKTPRGSATTVGSLLEDLLASEVYDINLSSAQQNKPLTLTLSYDKALVTDTGSLRIRQYNASSGEWEEVPGNYTVDPLSGVVSVEVESLQEASQGSDSSTPLSAKGVQKSKGRRAYGRAAVSAQGVFVPNALAATSQEAQFAVFAAAPPTGVAYGGGTFEMYNLPNPFDLKSKQVNVSSDGAGIFGASVFVRGTLIKYHLPAAKTGDVKLLIYNMAGERVRQIDEGNRAGGFIYYSEWDGRNDKGDDCASGVYFLMAQVDGKRLAAKAHKLALVK